MDKSRILIVCFAILGFGGRVGVFGLLCNCTTSQCEKNGYRCETMGACMVSTSLINGQHIQLCIDKEKLVPPGQPFFCLSAKGLLNVHCCYTDYCNSLDLKVHSGTVQSGSAEQIGGWELVKVAIMVVGFMFTV